MGRKKIKLEPLPKYSMDNGKVLFICAEYKHITIRYDSKGPFPELLIDRSKIEQVLNNLLSNAVKFSFESATVR
jgi:signal transduction histidine kinase